MSAETPHKTQKYLSIPALAKLLGISRIAVYKKVKNGQIPAKKVGRNYVIYREGISCQESHISIPQLAQSLGISRIAVYKKVKNGQLEAQKIGRNYAVDKEILKELPEAVQNISYNPQEYLNKSEEKVSIPQMAELMGVSRIAVYKKVKSGEIRAKKAGRNYVVASETNIVKEQYISIPQLAQSLGISRIAVYKKVKNGQLEAQKIGRNYVIVKTRAEELLIKAKSKNIGKKDND